MNESKEPVVLAHGIARFDVLWHPLVQILPKVIANRFDGLQYFRNIRTHLEAHAFDVIAASVPFAVSLEHRALSLAKQLTTIAMERGRQVHVIGHSMGGLDARYAIANLGSDRYVSCLSTIGAPHNGTSFADWGVEHHEHEIVHALHPLIDLSGLNDLTTAVWARNNHDWFEAESRNSVSYHIYGASQEREAVFSPLRRPWRIISDREGENDGLVPLTSQLWAGGLPSLNSAFFARKTVESHQIPLQLDHLNECGWWDRNEHEQRAIFEGQVKGFISSDRRTGVPCEVR